jgi:hypothetical protein
MTSGCHHGHGSWGAHPERIALVAGKQVICTMTREQPAAWIEDLRGRLERGKLAEVGPVHMPSWVEMDDVEACVRGLFREVDYGRTRPIAERRRPAPQRIQGHIARQLAALYQALVEGKTWSEPWSPMGPRADW